MAPAALLATACAFGQIRDLKPGFNLFTRDQDIQLGREAAAEVESKLSTVHDARLTAYVQRLGRTLARSPHAGGYPFEFHIVNDKNINAFALPGGPVFLNTGLIEACDNEAQLAGTMAHEMSHIALRHGTSQATKQNLIELPVLLAGAVMGHGGLLGQLAQAGIGLGADSVLLKFSRGNESEADYNGVEIMADAGYNPIELARFFEKLQAQAGQGNTRIEQFLSDHPNPGNRTVAIEDEIRYLPRRRYDAETGQFERVKALTARIAPAPDSSGHTPATPADRPNRAFRRFDAPSFSFSYPDNWRAFAGDDANSLTVAPEDGIVQPAAGASAVGRGLMVSYYSPRGGGRGTDAFIHDLERRNADLHVTRPGREIDVNGARGLLTTLNSRSPYQGEDREVDVLLTVERPQGLFYMVFIAPGSEYASTERVFEEIVRSIRFRR
jgi:Zn-dependent protease with chaperone function